MTSGKTAASLHQFDADGVFLIDRALKSPLPNGSENNYHSRHFGVYPMLFWISWDSVDRPDLAYLALAMKPTAALLILTRLRFRIDSDRLRHRASEGRTKELLSENPLPLLT
jgi:hypothetical protein